MYTCMYTSVVKSFHTSVNSIAIMGFRQRLIALGHLFTVGKMDYNE